MFWASTFAAPYALRGRRGVSSSCGDRAALANTSLLEAWHKRPRGLGPYRLEQVNDSEPVDSGCGHDIVEKLGARCARREVVEMIGPVSLDQCADRLAVRKIQPQHFDLSCCTCKPGPQCAAMGRADDSIALRSQQFREIGTVLAEHPGYQGRLRIAFTHAAAPRHSSGCGGDRRGPLCASAQTRTHRQAPADLITARARAPPSRGASANARSAARGGCKPGTPSTNTSPWRATGAKCPGCAKARVGSLSRAPLPKCAQTTTRAPAM